MNIKLMGIYVCATLLTMHTIFARLAALLPYARHLSLTHTHALTHFPKQPGHAHQQSKSHKLLSVRCNIVETYI